MYRMCGKRLLDICIALAALLILSPLMVLIALGTWTFLGAPVLFTQPRPGLGGKPFRLVKFRTMSDSRDPNGGLLADEQRLTRWGSFLRTVSLDELPELFNVLTGSMSLIGPRPLLMSYLERYDEQQRRRHEVLPGITGWAQIHGRNAISWPEKFELDVWYVNHVSLRLDCEILFRTLGEVLRRRGIHAEGAATMPEFAGNDADMRIAQTARQ